MPIVYHGVLRYDAPNGNLRSSKSGVTGPPPVPEQGSVHALNLAFERIQLLSAIEQFGQEAAARTLRGADPQRVRARSSRRPRPSGSPRSRPRRCRRSAACSAGCCFALGAALLVDRADRTIRDPEEAALTFSAPVLSIIPADGDEFAVIAEPNSLAAEAYRGLAAMSIATDRLPKAMMVSTPDRRRARAGRRELRGRARRVSGSRSR